MQFPVEGGRSHDGITGKDLAPIGEGLVAGEHDGLMFFVALADGLEEQAGMGRFQREIANLIDDEQLGAGEVFDFAGETVFSAMARAMRRASSTALVK